jgi:2-succinyl-5-enolpyruvyl-6-hydroxy-3-cyclohexene-1-carboxylate synthase
MTAFHGPNHCAAHLIVNELNRLGIAEYVLSPGSRSTPLALALAAQAAPVTVHIDERGAAFYALGLGQASGRPAVLICTSGTAVANYLPAVVEASQSGIPLILVTADRPADVHRSGANQTILQNGIFSHYVRDCINIPAPSDNLAPRFVLSSVDRAFSRATGWSPGPVHINIEFRKPLITPTADSTNYGIPEEWRLGTSPYSIHSPAPIADSLPDAIVQLLSVAERGVIVAAQIRTAEHRDALIALAEQLGWPLVVESTSQLRLGPRHPLIMTNTGHYLEDAVTRDLLKPDVLLHIGGAPTCNGLLEYLRCAGHIVHISLNGQSVDLYQTVAVHGTAQNFAVIGEHLRELLTEGPARRPTQVALTSAFESCELRSRELIRATMATGNSELEALQAAIHAVPPDTAIFFGNSLPIRTSNLVESELGHYPRVGFNRGASGIDGIVASAVGFSAGLGAPLLLINGDLSTIHDANSLLLVRKSKLPVVVLVINNGGGAIFSTLPTFPAPEYFEQFFLTPQTVSIEGLAQFAGLAFHRVRSAGDLPALIQAAFTGRISTVIEFYTEWQTSSTALAALKSES